jgi:hypothetical protein
MKRPSEPNEEIDLKNDLEKRIKSLGYDWEDLPVELWVTILSSFSNVSVKSIEALCSSNSYFRSICQTNKIWQRIFRREFGNLNWTEATKNMPNNATDLEKLLLYRIIIKTRMFDMIGTGSNDNISQEFKNGKEKSMRLTVGTNYFLLKIITPDTVVDMNNLHRQYFQMYKNDVDIIYKLGGQFIKFTTLYDTNDKVYRLGYKILLDLIRMGYIYSDEIFFGCSVCFETDKKLIKGCSHCVHEKFCSVNCGMTHLEEKH